MSVNGINHSPLLPTLGSLARPETARTPNGAQPGAERAQQAATHARAAQQQAALKPQTPIAGQSAASSAVPAEAPAGTDPVLWSVLTNDERHFFAKSAALGPLTYSRIKAVTHPAPPTARGVRLDVRA